MWCQYLYFLFCLKTIIEPAKPFMKLLGLQKHRAEETYRLMYFVVQTEVDDGLLQLLLPAELPELQGVLCRDA